MVEQYLAILELNSVCVYVVNDMLNSSRDGYSLCHFQLSQLPINSVNWPTFLCIDPIKADNGVVNWDGNPQMAEVSAVAVNKHSDHSETCQMSRRRNLKKGLSANKTQFNCKAICFVWCDSCKRFYPQVLLFFLFFLGFWQDTCLF